MAGLEFLGRAASRPQGQRVMILWDARERPEPRCCHARPCGQVPASHREAYTNSSQSARFLFQSPARSWPWFPNPVPAPAVAAVAAASPDLPRVCGPSRYRRPWLSLVPVTEDEFLRGRAPSPRRPPAHFHLATGHPRNYGYLKGSTSVEGEPPPHSPWCLTPGIIHKLAFF